MKTIVKLLSILLFLFFITNTIAQTPMEEYVNKNGVEKIKKKFIVDALSHPATHKSFKDGHGKTPYLSSTDQLPDTIALITFHVNESYKDIDWSRTTEFEAENALKGGNTIANLIESHTLMSLKDAFKKRGAILLTPKEYLDTDRKITFYYEIFAPEVSKVGKFLSNIENRNIDLSFCASGYRYFDMGAALDYKRSQSLGGELINKIDVSGSLSISIVTSSSKKKGILVHSVKMAIHGPNPNPKIDKKYFGQKTGTGYYNGQLYFGGTFAFKKPIQIIDIANRKINLDGFEVILSSFIEKYYDEMEVAINKVSK